MNILLISLSFAFLVSIFLIVGGLIMMSSKSTPNDIRFWWRLLMILSGAVISIEVSIAFVNRETFFSTQTLSFSLRNIMEWFYIALLVSMIIVAGLQSRLKHWQKIFFPSLLGICTVVALCYEDFVGTYTVLGNCRDIFINFDKTDVRIRFIIFVISILTTTYLLYLPLYTRLLKKKVKPTKWLYIYIIFAHLQPLTYILYILVTPYSAVALAIGCLLFILIFTFPFLRNENPLIVSEETDKQTESIPITHVECRSVKDLPEFINDCQIYLNKFLTLEDLSRCASLPVSDIITEYKELGFSNFTDYISSFRLAHFKNLVDKNPRVPIWALASDSGFTSRSSFYRYFQSIEGISPTDYRKKA